MAKRFLTDEQSEILQKYDRCTHNYSECRPRDLDMGDKSLVQECVEKHLMKLGHRRKCLIFGERIETARLTSEGYIAMMNEYTRKFSILVRDEKGDRVIEVGGN